jgi:hypothetical protein
MNASDEYAVLMLATSPAVYSNLTAVAGLMGQPQNQGFCFSCVAFALAAAADAAVVMAGGCSGAAAGSSACSMSVQALFYGCARNDNRPPRTCSRGWQLQNAIEALHQHGASLPKANCLPYKPDLTDDVPRSKLCASSPACDAAPSPRPGNFEGRPIALEWLAQRHIRMHGAVVTRFDVYPDFRDYFKIHGRQAVYPGPGPGAKVSYGHAVALVGYDNERRFWVARNSWGSDWADGGYFRVRVVGGEAAPRARPPPPHRGVWDGWHQSNEGCFVRCAMTCPVRMSAWQPP